MWNLQQRHRSAAFEGRLLLMWRASRRSPLLRLALLAQAAALRRTSRRKHEHGRGQRRTRALGREAPHGMLTFPLLISLYFTLVCFLLPWMTVTHGEVMMRVTCRLPLRPRAGYGEAKPRGEALGGGSALMHDAMFDA